MAQLIPTDEMRSSRHRYRKYALSAAQKGLIALLLATFSCVYLLPTAAYALLCVDGIGNEPTQPYAPIDAWIALQDGDQHWYAFRDEGDDTPIRIRMTVVPEHSATFVILTPAQMALYRRGDAVTAVGAGSPSAVYHDDLYWTGSFVQSGIYYVLVESSGRGLSNYMLSIQGSQVSFPLLSFLQPQPPLASRDQECIVTPLATSATFSPSHPQATATPAAPFAQSSPEEPLPPIGREQSIQPGDVHWYAFRDEGDDGAIAIRATAHPAQCIAFALWTPEQLRLWRQNIEFQAVGEGTVNEQMSGDLFWTGSFVKSGIYHVVVTHNPAHDPTHTDACIYQLRVTGEDVSLLLPPRLP